MHIFLFELVSLQQPKRAVPEIAVMKQIFGKIKINYRTLQEAELRSNQKQKRIAIN